MAKAQVSSTSRFHRLLHQSGWFLLLLGCGGMLYFYAMGQKKRMVHEMTLTLHQLEKKKQDVLEAQGDLLLQIQSQSDPAWVEMVLRRNLGMISEGQVKVYFE